MDVRYYGFSLQVTGSPITVLDVFKNIEDQGVYIDEATKRKHERRFYIDAKSHADFILGLIVTVKDQKKFCTLVEEQGDVTITVENLRENEKMLDFNFFIVNKKNGMGLYQHYHQSCSVNIFGGYAKRFHTKCRDEFIQDALDKKREELGRELKGSEKTKVRSQFKSVFDFALLVRKESYQQILKAYKEIKSFEFEYAYLQPKKNKAQPINKLIERKKERLSFFRGGVVETTVNAISSYIKKNNIEQGRVRAVDFDGVDQILDIIDNPDIFGLEDYDKMAAKLHELNVSKFNTNKVLTEMISICKTKQNKPTFFAKIK